MQLASLSLRTSPGLASSQRACEDQPRPLLQGGLCTGLPGRAAGHLAHITQYSRAWWTVAQAEVGSLLHKVGTRTGAGPAGGEEGATQ